MPFGIYSSGIPPLRYDPPVVLVGRFALEPREIAARKVDAGHRLTCSLLAAGHDPAPHSNPHGFDIERAPRISSLTAGRITASARRSPGPRHKSPLLRCSSVFAGYGLTRSLPLSASAHWSSMDWKRFGCTPLDALRGWTLRGPRPR